MAKKSEILIVKGGWVRLLRMYDKDGSSLSVWNAYRGDGWVKKGRNLAYVLCTQPPLEIVFFGKDIYYSTLVVTYILREWEV